MNGKKWSIPTEYKGIQMRSRLEAKWAKYFDDNGIRWLYEPEGFQKDGVKYLPDFALPDLHIIFEVKGVMDDKDEKKKQMMAEICEAKGWKYVMGFSEIPDSFIIDSSGNEFAFDVVPKKETKKHLANYFNEDEYLEKVEAEMEKELVMPHDGDWRDLLARGKYLEAIYELGRLGVFFVKSPTNGKLMMRYRKSLVEKKLFLDELRSYLSEEYYKSGILECLKEKTKENEAVLLMIDELLIVYILHEATREKIKEIVEKFSSTIPENYFLFFKESGEKFNLEDSLEHLKSYFGSEKIRLLQDYMKRYDGTENYLSIINDVENELQVKEIRREMDDLGEKIMEAKTEEEKLPMIKKYLEFKKQINKLRIRD